MPRSLSAPGYSVAFKPMMIDNSISNKCRSTYGSFVVHFGICGGNFDFKIGRTYSATLKAIDASPSSCSLDNKTMLFTTTDNSPRFLDFD